MKTTDQAISETLQRVTRLETRLFHIANHLGITLKDHEEIELDVEARIITMQTLDVPYTTVINACHRAGLYRTKVRVKLGDRVIGEVYV